jgi:hypothetical protein
MTLRFEAWCEGFGISLDEYFAEQRRDKEDDSNDRDDDRRMKGGA